MSLQCAGWVVASGGMEKSGGRQGRWRSLNAIDSILKSILEASGLFGRPGVGGLVAEGKNLFANIGNCLS